MNTTAASAFKSGIVFADNINTVSPNYAREVQTDPAMGFGLEGLLRYRSKNFCGIVNGIDTEVWDPEIDPVLPIGYDVSESVKGKLAAKLALQQQCKLSQEPDKPLIGIVSRLDYQKGLDIVVNLIERLKGRVQFVVLGMGDPMLEKPTKAWRATILPASAITAGWTKIWRTAFTRVRICF